MKKSNTSIPAVTLPDVKEVKKAALVLRALNHKLRRSLIEAIEERPNMTVTEIYVKFRLEQSVASQHLAILRKAGLVKTNREGKFVMYELDRESMKKVNEVIVLLTAN